MPREKERQKTILLKKEWNNKKWYKFEPWSLIVLKWNFITRMKDKPITRVLIGFHDHIEAYSCYILEHKNDCIQVHESIWFLVCNQIYRRMSKYLYSIFGL
jgi:hypothetical protein